MKERLPYSATKAPVLVAAVLMFAGGVGFARAEEPAANMPAEESTAAPSAAPIETTAAPAPAETAQPAPEIALPAPALPAPAPEPPAPVQAPVEPAPQSWFARPPLTLTVGEGARQFRLTLYGFVEADYMFDTTRSYNDAMGSSLVARTDTLNGNNSRSQFSMRNSRLGFAFDSPSVGSIHASAVLEADFFGYQDNPPHTSESTFFNSPTFRIRHGYVKLASPYLDVILGQTYDLFGWQNLSSPCSLQFLGLPNQLFSRNPQLRLSRGFGADGPVGLELAISAGRPVQRDSQVPDGSAGVRIILNGWKGITTPGNVGTTAQSASIGVSAIVRQFKVNAFAPPPVREANTTTGWGVAADAFLPIIPAASAADRSNKLTLTGSFVQGTGIADLITSGGGAKFPNMPNPGQAIPAPVYQQNIDSALVAFDANGVVHTINWMAFRVGLQYYLPPTGRLIFSANYTESRSDNLSKLYHKGAVDVELLGETVDISRYVDGNLFWDATPALRLGISGQYTQVEYLDGSKPHNIRGMAQTVYVF